MYAIIATGGKAVQSMLKAICIKVEKLGCRSW